MNYMHLFNILIRILLKEIHSGCRERQQESCSSCLSRTEACSVRNAWQYPRPDAHLCNEHRILDQTHHTWRWSRCLSERSILCSRIPKTKLNQDSLAKLFDITPISISKSITNTGNVNCSINWWLSDCTARCCCHIFMIHGAMKIPTRIIIDHSLFQEECWHRLQNLIEMQYDSTNLEHRYEL